MIFHAPSNLIHNSSKAQESQSDKAFGQDLDVSDFVR
jgi:hypothetical protein